MTGVPLKFAHKNPLRELLAGIAIVAVFWLVMQIEGYLYLQGVHEYQGAMIHVAALALALVIADQIGRISYTAVALIVLFGITGYITADYYVFTIKSGHTHTFGPWYAYIFPSVFACMFLFWIRRLKLFFNELKTAPG